MNIYQELKRDHREAKAMLNELVNLEKDDDYRFLLIVEIRNALISHSRTEEAVFYNSLRSLRSDHAEAAKLARHSYREHFEIEALLRALQLMDKMDGNWRPMARKLRDQVNHHLKVEEGEIFPMARLLFTSEESERMGELYRKLKPQIQQEGDMRTTLDLAMNFLPPKYAAKMFSNIKSL